MSKISDFIPFLKLIKKGFRVKLSLIFISGFLNSLFQGIGIVLIIPLLEAYQSGGESTNEIAVFLKEIGWTGSLNWLLVAYFFILIGFAVFKAVNTYLSQVVITQFSNQEAVKSIKSILNAKWNFFLKYSPSQLTNLFNTEARSVKMLAFSSFRLLQSGVLVIVQLALAFWISWELSLITSIVLLLLYFFQRSFIQKGFDVGKDRVKLNEKMQLLLSETFSSIKFLKLHALSKKKSDEYERRVKLVYDNELRKSKLDAWSELIFITVGSIVIIGVIYIGLTFKLVAVSELLVLLVLMTRAINQTQGLLKTLNQLINQLPSFTRFNQILALSNQLQEQQTQNNLRVKVEHSIELQNVSFGYNEKRVLQNLNIKFEVGNIYLLFGESGKGKTTTLDLISGLIFPEEGNVLVDGVVTGNISDLELSYVLQDTILFEGTIKDNICVGTNYSDDEIRTTIEEAGLNELISKLPTGLDTLIKEGGVGLSGGEKQRIAIARAIIRNTKVLLLDEVTSALDAQNETKILETISALKKERIVIIVAHRERIKDWADFVIKY